MYGKGVRAGEYNTFDDRTSVLCLHRRYRTHSRFCSQTRLVLLYGNVLLRPFFFFSLLLFPLTCCYLSFSSRSPGPIGGIWLRRASAGVDCTSYSTYYPAWSLVTGSSGQKNGCRGSTMALHTYRRNRYLSLHTFEIAFFFFFSLLGQESVFVQFPGRGRAFLYPLLGDLSR